MSARLARSAFASLRAAARPRANYALPVRRNMSAQSHGAQPKKSDLPWIIGAAVVFGPMFLYLVSPSARKAQHAHAVHNDKHDFPTLEKEKAERQSKQHEIMKDDEGTPADVTHSIALSQGSDVPKDAQSPEATAATLTAAEQAPVGEEANKEEGATEATTAEEKTEESAPEEPAQEENPPAEGKKLKTTPDTKPDEAAKSTSPSTASAEKLQG